MKKVVMVCLGNICRSPMAEGLLREKVNPEEVQVDSAGTADYHIGQPPDERMIETAGNHGIDISGLRGRQFGVGDFDQFDYIFAMDNANYRNIIKLARTAKDTEKVSLITNLLHPGENNDVPDPYYGGKTGFEKVYQLLDRCTSELVKRLKQG